MQCRTSALGGHIDCCDKCGHTRPSYNSCRNRHCPKCQFVKKARWVDKLGSNLPPVRHFHVVFTVPSCLNKVFYLNQQKAYAMLFNAAGQALLQCAANPGFLGAQAGAVAILHTWGQNLAYHPHIHMIVPAGGLSLDQMEWVPSNRNFFVPVKALSKVFRGILCRMLEKGFNDGQIKLPTELREFKQVKDNCYRKNWVVYCEKPFLTVDNLINYLGNYTHRVAISNSRIKGYHNGKVSFEYKDYRVKGMIKEMTLDASEFINRFMQHILPTGFYKVRYFGFMAICNIKTKLAECFLLIGKATYLPKFEGLSSLEVWRMISGTDPLVCPKCKMGRMLLQSQVQCIVPAPG